MTDRRDDGSPTWQTKPSQSMVQGVRGMWGDPVEPAVVRIPTPAPVWSPHREHVPPGLEFSEDAGQWVAPEPTMDEIGERIYGTN